MLLMPCLPLRAPCLPRRARVLASEAGSEVDAALLSAVAADHEAECAAGLAQYPTCATAAARPISTREIDDPFEFTQDHPFVGCPVRLASSLLPADACSLIISEARERDTWDSRYTYAGSSDEAHLYLLPSSHAAVSAALPDVCAAAATLLAPQLPRRWCSSSSGQRRPFGRRGPTSLQPPRTPRGGCPSGALLLALLQALVS